MEWTTEKRYRRDYTETLQREESGNYRSGACPDHIHMLVGVPPYLSIAQFMGQKRQPRHSGCRRIVMRCQISIPVDGYAGIKPF